MTIDEHDDPTARLIRERGAAKRRRAMLQNKLREAGESLHEIGGALKYTGSERIGSSIAYLLPKLSRAPANCDLGRIRMILEELKEVETKLAHLNRIASEMGERSQASRLYEPERGFIEALAKFSLINRMPQ